MDWLSELVAKQGYSILALLLFLESIGMPIPAAIGLVVAGASSMRGPLHLHFVIATGVATMLAGDLLMFMLGRYTGWWLLGVLCRISLNPESCVFQSASSFYRNGRKILLFAKFLPGMNTMATPLAGSMNMRVGQFLTLDGVGVLVYVSAYASVGFLFSDFLAAIQRGYHTFSSMLEWTLGVAVLLWLGWRVLAMYRGRARVPVVAVAPGEVPNGALIVDVRSHGYYDAKALRIKRSIRMEPGALDVQLAEILASTRSPKDELVYVYCTCLRAATAVRVARELRGRGIHAAVIKGGLRAWQKAGLPVEQVPATEVEILPTFS